MLLDLHGTVEVLWFCLSVSISDHDSSCQLNWDEINWKHTSGKKCDRFFITSNFVCLWIHFFFSSFYCFPFLVFSVYGYGSWFLSDFKDLIRIFLRGEGLLAGRCASVEASQAAAASHVSSTHTHIHTHTSHTHTPHAYHKHTHDTTLIRILGCEL